MADEFFDVELNYDAANGISEGTYLFKVLNVKPYVKKDDTGAPTGKKAIIVELEAVAGSNPDGLGMTHEEFFHCPEASDDGRQRAFKQEKLVALAIAGQLVTAEQAKGKGSPPFALLKDRNFVGTIVKKNGFTNLDNLKRTDDPAVAHIVNSAAPAPARAPQII